MTKSAVSLDDAAIRAAPLIFTKNGKKKLVVCSVVSAPSNEN